MKAGVKVRMADAKEKSKPGLLARIRRSVKDMRGEMKKVVWPTKKQTRNNTVVVLAFMLVMAVIIGLLDTGLSAVIRLVTGG